MKFNQLPTSIKVILGGIIVSSFCVGLLIGSVVLPEDFGLASTESPSITPTNLTNPPTLTPTSTATIQSNATSLPPITPTPSPTHTLIAVADPNQDSKNSPPEASQQPPKEPDNPPAKATNTPLPPQTVTPPPKPTTFTVVPGSGGGNTNTE